MIVGQGMHRCTLASGSVPIMVEELMSDNTWRQFSPKEMLEFTKRWD